MRFYYKKPDGSAWYSLKTPFTKEEVEAKGLVVITAAEFDAHVAELEAEKNDHEEGATVPEVASAEPEGETVGTEETATEPAAE